jgi:hypothetical protein
LINSALLVRQLGPADRDAYFQLRLRGLKAHPESFGQSYEEAVAKGAARHDAMLQGARAAEGDFLLGAYASDNAPLIGVVGLVRNQRDKERHKASVVGMYELLARAAQIEDLRQIQLMVSSRNEAARRLYESLGFRKYGCEIDALNVGGVFHDADLMARFM